MTDIGALLSQLVIDKREAQMLLAHVLNTSRALVIAHPEKILDDVQEKLVRRMFTRRAAGEPIAYLLGMREFYGRDFEVSPATLVPRPETELLVEQALERISGHINAENGSSARVYQLSAREHPNILDLGTGSGAIAVTLALERPEANIVAADISPEALKIAAGNASRLKASIVFIESDWYANIGGRKFDLIVSNPPYVAGSDVHLSQGDLRFEPQIALTDNSRDGLSSIRTIIDGATSHLNPGGWLLFEHGFDQADACRELLLKAGFRNRISVKDLSGIVRVAGGQIR